MRRPAFSLLVAAFLTVPATAHAQSTPPTIAPGVSVAGVDVSGLTRDEAEIRLRKQLVEPGARTLVVRAGGQTARLEPEAYGIRLSAAGLARRALLAGRRAGGQPVDLELGVHADRRKVLAAVAALGDRVRRSPTSPRLQITVRRVRVRGGSAGRSLANPAGLVRRIREQLAAPRSPRLLAWSTRRVSPMSIRRYALIRGTVVTVSKRRKLVRVFVPRRGRYLRVAMYRVAIGARGYPTPSGLFRVQSKQVNPAWNVPNASWAGDLAGTVVPGGDPRNPLKARWIGFAGGVGFHGTADIGSIGTRASHGCVRMRVPDIKRMYRRVRIGTPVLVR